MKAQAHELIDAAARSLAGKAHTVEDLSAALFQLVLAVVSPGRLDVPSSLRRTPAANEVLPRHQRATWARAMTEYDVES
jgi:hypothetical protein